MKFNTANWVTDYSVEMSRKEASNIVSDINRFLSVFTINKVPVDVKIVHNEWKLNKKRNEKSEWVTSGSTLWLQLDKESNHLLEIVDHLNLIFRGNYIPYDENGQRMVEWAFSERPVWMQYPAGSRFDLDLKRKKHLENIRSNKAAFNLQKERENLVNTARVRKKFLSMSYYESRLEATKMQANVSVIKQNAEWAATRSADLIKSFSFLKKV